MIDANQLSDRLRGLNSMFIETVYRVNDVCRSMRSLSRLSEETVSRSVRKIIVLQDETLQDEKYISSELNRAVKLRTSAEDTTHRCGELNNNSKVTVQRGFVLQQAWEKRTQSAIARLGRAEEGLVAAQEELASRRDEEAAAEFYLAECVQNEDHALRLVSSAENQVSNRQRELHNAHSEYNNTLRRQDEKAQNALKRIAGKIDRLESDLVSAQREFQKAERNYHEAQSRRIIAEASLDTARAARQRAEQRVIAAEEEVGKAKIELSYATEGREAAKTLLDRLSALATSTEELLGTAQHGNKNVSLAAEGIQHEMEGVKNRVTSCKDLRAEVPQLTKVQENGHSKLVEADDAMNKCNLVCRAGNAELGKRISALQNL